MTGQRGWYDCPRCGARRFVGDGNDGMHETCRPGSTDLLLRLGLLERDVETLRARVDELAATVRAIRDPVQT